MELSNNSYTKFHANKEKFRIEKLLGIRTKQRNVYKDRGTMLHLLCEGQHHKWTDAEIQRRIKEQELLDEGVIAGYALWPTLKSEYVDLTEVLDVEVEYKVPLLDKDGKETGHFMTGRIDVVAKDQFGRIKLVDYKTSKQLNDWSRKRKKSEIEREWRAKPKVGFDLIGAGWLGYPAEYMEVVMVVEDTPPYIIGPVGPFSWDQYKLEYLQRSVLQTCKIIEFMIAEFGVEEPWPHVIHSMWDSEMGSCNSLNEDFQCELKEICGTRITETPDGFIKREEEPAVAA